MGCVHGLQSQTRLQTHTQAPRGCISMAKQRPVIVLGSGAVWDVEGETKTSRLKEPQSHAQPKTAGRYLPAFT